MFVQAAQRKKIIFVLGVLSAIGPLSIDMYLPAFKFIAVGLNCDQIQVGYTLSSFFAGICLGQLINGPLLDQFGRKKVLFSGLSIYVIASFLCALTTKVEYLIVFRFIQALGASVGTVAPNAIVRETFPAAERPKVLALLVLILGVSPLLAPTIGGILLEFMDWHAIFYLLGGLILVILILIQRWLPENHTLQKAENFHIKSVLQAYKKVFKQKQFLYFALASAMGSASILAFVGGSPMVLLNFFQLSEQQFGWAFAVCASGIIGASQFNHLLLKKYTGLQVLSVVMPLQLGFSIILSIGSYFGYLNLVSTLFLIFLFLACQGLTFPNIIGYAMMPFHQGAGSASALMGAFQMAFGAISSSLVSLFFNGTAFSMVCVMGCCSLIANVLFFAKGKQLGAQVN